MFLGRKGSFLRLFPFALLCSLLLLAAPRERAQNLKMVIRTRMGNLGASNGHPFQETVYVKGQRARQDFRLFSGVPSKPGGGGPLIYYYGHRASTIWQCDRRRVYELDLDAREYTVTELGARGLRANLKRQRAPHSGATVTVTIESHDTGERKRLFGLLARHIVTHEKIVAGPGACTHSEQIDQDGWYADPPAAPSCFPALRPRKTGLLIPQAQCNGKEDKVEVRRSGIAVAGFPLELTKIVRSQRVLPGQASQTLTESLSQDVTELSQARLDPGLFEVPAGFQRVQKLNLQPAVPPRPLSVRLRSALRFQWERLKNFLRSVF